MQIINIKKALLEGHTPEVIVEAVHANHPHLDKKPGTPGDTHNKTGDWLHNVKDYRNELAKDIRAHRTKRDAGMDPAFHDNMARLRSSNANFFDKNIGVEHVNKQKFSSIPRLISSAKK